MSLLCIYSPRALEKLEKVKMEKPTDSGRGEKRKHEGESMDDAPWPRSKSSSKDLEIMEQRFFLQSEGECPWRSAEGEDFPAPKILKSFYLPLFWTTAFRCL